jgi:protein O-mannosyl-transferase
MSVERSTTISLSQPHPWLAIELACSVVVLIAAILRREKNPALVEGLFWFVLCIAPFCLVMNYQGVAERFDYAASLGIVVAIVAACSIAPQPQLRKGLILCVAAWSIWNLYRTSVRVADWSDAVRLYSSSLQATPLSPVVHYNLAFSLRERGDLQAALEEYQRTLEIDRHYPNGLAALGDVYLQLKSFATAQAIYQQALTQNPNDTAVLLNSGAAYQGSGELANAEAAYQRILQINPQSSDAHVNLGVLYSSEQRQTDAMHQFAMAIDLKTKDITPYYDLAILFQQAGRGDLALALYKKVLELKPDDEDTLRNIRILQATPMR